MEALKRYDEAIGAYVRAIELEPTDPYYHHNLAGVYLACGRLEEATVEYDKRIELSPDNAQNANITLGIILWHQGQVNKARYHFENALSIWENAGAAQIQTPAGLLENRRSRCYAWETSRTRSQLSRRRSPQRRLQTDSTLMMSDTHCSPAHRIRPMSLISSGL